MSVLRVDHLPPAGGGGGGGGGGGLQCTPPLSPFRIMQPANAGAGAAQVTATATAAAITLVFFMVSSLAVVGKVVGCT
jgi:hypothetical protein